MPFVTGVVQLKAVLIERRELSRGVWGIDLGWKEGHEQRNHIPVSEGPPPP